MELTAEQQEDLRPLLKLLFNLEGSDWLYDYCYDYDHEDGSYEEMMNKFQAALAVIERIVNSPKRLSEIDHIAVDSDHVCVGGHLLYRQVVEHSIDEGSLLFGTDESVVVCSACERQFNFSWDAQGRVIVGQPHD